MSEIGRVLYCGKCQRILDEPFDLEPSQRQPCPSCGSVSRHVKISIHESLTLHGKIKLKAHSGNKKRPVAEIVSGDDLHRSSGKWMKLERIINRENDRYKETVTNPETGEIIHECDEPLSEHKGHDAAKGKEE